jgi:hypothetical protein
MADQLVIYDTDTVAEFIPVRLTVDELNEIGNESDGGVALNAVSLLLRVGIIPVKVSELQAAARDLLEVRRMWAARPVQREHEARSEDVPRFVAFLATFQVREYTVVPGDGEDGYATVRWIDGQGEPVDVSEFPSFRLPDPNDASTLATEALVEWLRLYASALSQVGSGQERFPQGAPGYWLGQAAIRFASLAAGR